MLPFRISARHGQLLIIVGLLLGLAACRQAAGGVPLDAPADTADISLALAPAAGAQPLPLEPLTWEVSLTDAAGAAIEGAAVTVRGDMSHAGMAPVEATAANAGDGLYRADFAWTMGGDWIITVTATLPDGRVKSQTFNYTVTAR